MSWGCNLPDYYRSMGFTHRCCIAPFQVDGLHPSLLYCALSGLDWNKKTPYLEKIGRFFIGCYVMAMPVFLVSFV